MSSYSARILVPRGHPELDSMIQGEALMAEGLSFLSKNEASRGTVGAACLLPLTEMLPWDPEGTACTGQPAGEGRLVPSATPQPSLDFLFGGKDNPSSFRLQFVMFPVAQAWTCLAGCNGTHFPSRQNLNEAL